MSLPDPCDDPGVESLLRRSAVLVDARDAAVQRAVDLWRPRRPSPRRSGSLRRLLAVPSFDSALLPLAPGLRAGPQRTRQMLFCADGRDIDLRIRGGAGSEADAFEVAGQILGPDLHGVAHLSRLPDTPGATFAATRPWGELAEFCFEQVPAGRCKLVLQSGDWEIELPPIELAAA